MSIIFGSVGKYAFCGSDESSKPGRASIHVGGRKSSAPHCVNVVALKRKNFSSGTIAAINEVFRLLFRSRVGVQNAREILMSEGNPGEEVQAILEFIEFSNAGRHGRGRDRRRAVA